MRGSRGFTLIELLIVLGIIGVLATIAIPGYQAARIRGRETAAITALDTINKAQFAYMETCGNQRYAPTLVSLGVPAPGTGTAFLSPDLAQVDPLSKSGYLIQLSGTEMIDNASPTCTGATPVSAYQVTADPLNPGVSGSRYFGTNADRVIFEDQASFASNMPETGAPPHGREIK
jgi:prepilin-type N-terminal cleavage/methylation domain-containing protein